MEEFILQVKNLSYSYPNRKDITLDNISFCVKKGEKVAFIGPNGAGKTTLFLHLNGIIKSEINKILINNKDINAMVLKERVCKIAILFSDPETQLIMPTVYDDIAFGPTNLNLSKEEVDNRVENILSLMNLNTLKNRVPQHLSTGQKKKVAFASILSLNPEILVLDEPTANLDPKSKNEIIDLINLLNKRGTTIITSTHDLGILSEISNTVYILNKKIIAFGTPLEILKKNELLLKNNLETPDIYQLFSLFQQMDFVVDKLPLNLKDALLEILKKITKQVDGVIKLHYNNSIISLIYNLLSKKNK